MEPIGTGKLKCMFSPGMQGLKMANDTALAIAQAVPKRKFYPSCRILTRTKYLWVKEIVDSKSNRSASSRLSSMVPLKSALPLLHHRCFLQQHHPWTLHRNSSSAWNGREKSDWGKWIAAYGQVGVQTRDVRKWPERCKVDALAFVSRLSVRLLVWINNGGTERCTGKPNISIHLTHKHKHTRTHAHTHTHTHTQARLTTTYRSKYTFK